jgi:hypothetical protein
LLDNCLYVVTKEGPYCYLRKIDLSSPSREVKVVVLSEKKSLSLETISTNNLANFAYTTIGCQSYEILSRITKKESNYRISALFCLPMDSKNLSKGTFQLPVQLINDTQNISFTWFQSLTAKEQHQEM